MDENNDSLTEGVKPSKIPRRAAKAYFVIHTFFQSRIREKNLMLANNTPLLRKRISRFQPAHPRTTLLFRLFLLTVPLSFLLAACSQPGSQSGNQSGGSGTQPVGQSGTWNTIFHDDFNGNALDTTKWTTCYFNFKVGDNSCDHDQGEMELYQPDNVSVSSGVLTLSAQKQTVNASNGQTYNYTSGMITTGPTTANS